MQTAPGERGMAQKTLENPFEKVTAEQLNHDLLAYLFAKPQAAVYNKLTNRENYIIVGGWGSGKTTLLKYVSFETQMEALKGRISGAEFFGVYIKIGQSGFKPFLKPGGDFKEGGEALFGHYFNLLILERMLSIVICAKDKGWFDISEEEENRLVRKLSSKIPFVRRDTSENTQSKEAMQNKGMACFKNDLENWRLEIETFLNTRDLERDLSYKEVLSVGITSIRTFLDEAVKDIQGSINALSRKRFYILLDECDLLSIGQQRIVNTIIKSRFTTMVFKLASRPPDIKTMETVDEGIGLTDREVKRLYLDEMYDPVSSSYRKLCYSVAEKRLMQYGYPIKDIRKILGKYTVEDEVGKEIIENYLRQKYGNKQRVESKFDEVYKDFKVAAAFQVLRTKRLRKKYGGFDTFVMLSSGIMLHFLELCRDAFTFSFGNAIVREKSGDVGFRKLPLPIEIQNKAAYKVSGDFYNNIEGRAESLKDTSIDMEFGAKIQYIVGVLGGIFRDKLMSFNEPEALRIDITEGKRALDDNLGNPIMQIFERGIAISVFQRCASAPYMPKRIGGTKPPQTYILNRVLAPYFRISPRTRWRTKIPAKAFNKILIIGSSEFAAEILGKRIHKRTKIRKKIRRSSEAVPPKSQLSLSPFQLSETMPILITLGNTIKGKPFEGKTLLLALHFLKDLVPFVESCKKLGATPSETFLLYKRYRYPDRETIEHFLRSQGFKTCPIEEVDTVLEQLQSLRPRGLMKNILVIEDGGYIVPKLHHRFKDLADFTLGAVEQTTRGIRNDRTIKQMKFPVISIPGSKLKAEFEPPNVALAIINNIQNVLPNRNFSGRGALVIGFGAIGQEVAVKLRDMLKMQVSVYDVNSDAMTHANEQGFATEENLKSSVKDKFLIVGATGEKSIGKHEILQMEHNVFLVSASSEQLEFCVEELNALSSREEKLRDNGDEIGTKYVIRNTSKEVNLLADGFPINFWKSESMPNEVSDVIMSLLLIAAVELASGERMEPKIDEQIVNKLSEKYEVSKLFRGFRGLG